jgi:tetratricopeptide (TPR) repeat protein
VYDHTAEFLPVRANMIGDAQQGTKILQDWTELHPSDFLARVELAGLLGQKGDRTKSLAIYRELNFGWALYQMGYNAMAHKQLRQAFEYLSMAVDLEPELVEARQALSEAQQDYALSLYRLGSNAREHGQIENAIEYLYMAVEVKPTFTEARFTLAEIQYDLGSPEAENNYLIAAETCVAPELCADIQSRLGDLKSSEGDLDGAFSYYRLALQIWPDHWSAMIGIGQLYLRQGDKPEAIRWAFQALAVSPGNKWALRLLDESK